MDHNQKSFDYDQKFNFYWPVIIAGLLMFAVKTANFQGNKYCAIAEIIAWFMLGASLIISLLRIEKLSLLHRFIGSNDECDEVDREVDKHNLTLENLYSAQKWLFVIGLFLIIGSRGYLAALTGF